jgi:hypothetical protein
MSQTTDVLSEHPTSGGGLCGHGRGQHFLMDAVDRTTNSNMAINSNDYP